MIQKKNDKQHLQSTTQKTNNRATPLKTEVNSGDLDGQAVPAQTKYMLTLPVDSW
jgi:hypothetical protein